MAGRGLPAAVALLLAAAIAPGQDAPVGAGSALPPAGSALEDLDRASRSIMERCGPAVVRVDAERTVSLRVLVDDPLARKDLDDALHLLVARETVAATGFLVDGSGLVLTASAVVGGNPSAIRVTFPGRGVREGRLVGEDVLAGVALLRVDPVEGVEPLAFAQDPAPAGALTLLLAPSAGGPALRIGFVTEPRRAFGAYDAWLVSSVPVEAGEAGAPLLDARGMVLGQHVPARRGFRFSNAVSPAPVESASRNLQELSQNRMRVERSAPFATFVPATELRRIVAELAERGTVRRGMAGVRIGRDEPLVTGTLEDGPAARAGIRAGDLVLSVDGTEIGSGMEFGGFIGRRTPGTTVRLRLRSPGPEAAERETTLVLGELPPPPPRGGLFNGLGVVTTAVAPDLSAARFSSEAVPDGRWVMVETVAPSSAAAAAGIQPGDWIVEIEGVPVLSEETYIRLATSPPPPGFSVRVLVYRPGEAERRLLTLK